MFVDDIIFSTVGHKGKLGLQRTDFKAGWDCTPWAKYDICDCFVCSCFFTHAAQAMREY